MLYDTPVEDQSGDCVMVDTPVGRQCVYPGDQYYPASGQGVVSPSSATISHPVNTNISVPQPGTVPVQPGTGLFAQVLEALVKGATPIGQAEIALAAQNSQITGAPIHVPAGVVRQVKQGQPGQATASMQYGAGSQFPTWAYVLGGVLGGLVILALLKKSPKAKRK